MGCLGVHFALDEATVAKLKSFWRSASRLRFVQEVIEETWPEEWAQETDKAWDAIHRALTDGGLDCDRRHYPLSHAVLGGRSLYSGEDYLMILKTREEVRDVAAALAQITQADFRSRYHAIDPESYRANVDEEDFEYTWDWFEPLREFYQRAAGASRDVLFTADQ